MPVIPPLTIDRVIAHYRLEDGSYISPVAYGKASTTELLNAIQPLIDLKRAEIARRTDEEKQ